MLFHASLWFLPPTTVVAGRQFFSQASVSHSVHGGRVSLASCPFQWVGIFDPSPFQGVWYVERSGAYSPLNLGPEEGWVCVGGVGTHPPLGIIPGGGYSPPHHPLLTHSGSHQTYSRHVGSVHPTGIFSCLLIASPCR